jgi:hypothetical protein
VRQGLESLYYCCNWLIHLAWLHLPGARTLEWLQRHAVAYPSGRRCPSNAAVACGTCRGGCKGKTSHSGQEWQHQTSFVVKVDCLVMILLLPAGRAGKFSGGLTGLVWHNDSATNKTALVVALVPLASRVALGRRQPLADSEVPVPRWRPLPTREVPHAGPYCTSVSRYSVRERQ